MFVIPITPLTAMMKRSRSATAVRVSAAISVACLSSYRIGICKYLDFHENVSNAD
jgi:hypothetical protein